VVLLGLGHVEILGVAPPAPETSSAPATPHLYPARVPVLEFLADPRSFLDAAGEHLAADPVQNTVVATVSARAVDEDAAGVPLPVGLDRWWAVARDGHGRVVGTAMRTAPAAPFPAFVGSMPEEAAAALGRAVVARGALLTSLNGALPAARVCAEEVARATGGRVAVAEHTRLFELRELRDPPAVPGRLVPASADDVDLAIAWFDAFAVDADRQAGREPVPDPLRQDRPAMERRVAAGRVWFWEDVPGHRVHVVGANPPAYGVTRIGPVYTPEAERGRGWAGAAVAELSRRVLAAGERPVLYTDQANPVSNRVYERLGYEAVVDQANLEIVPGSR
jgi:GNAT superfamily N-acetyltransferase